MRISTTSSTLIVAASMLASACTSTDAAAPPPAAPAESDAVEAAMVELPAPGSDVPEPAAGRPVALVNDVGQLALVDAAGDVDDRWFKFRAVTAPDGSWAVLSLPPEIEGIGPQRPIVWVDLRSGNEVANHQMANDQEVTATSLDGTFAALTTLADDTEPDAIAGARTESRITIMSRDDGVVFEQTLEGNFVPEAFSRRGAGGIPAQLFLLEFFPADAPRFYRVRVLSTESGEVSLPLNLRNKQEQVDERMAGFTRSQVVAHEHGLLFTLYRGTIDGTPDGEPYAFVHTLDFADGVWCLDVDPRLGLEEHAGSLAVGGDRLYVASANGHIGSFPIPSITDPDLSPSMDWTLEVHRRTETAPVAVADDDGVWIGPADGASRLIRIDADGRRGDPLGLPGGSPTALSRSVEGELVAIGESWSTFELVRRPDWLERVVRIVPV